MVSWLDISVAIKLKLKNDLKIKIKNDYWGRILIVDVDIDK